MENQGFEAANSEKNKEDETNSLRDLEVIRDILTEGDPEELERLRLFWELTENQIEAAIKFTKDRKEIIRKAFEGKRRRIDHGIAPSEEELNVGSFKEMIEPQVIDAVLSLRRKGYNTIESGFDDPWGHQLISFKDDLPKDIKIPLDLESELKEKGVTIRIEEKRVNLFFDRYLDSEQIKGIWDGIEDLFPDLGHHADECRTGWGERFRKELDNSK